MFNVIFEVHPHAATFEQYLALALHLKPILTATDGFLDNERFKSLKRAGWVLSLSTWRDEKSLVRWRTEAEHHRVQELGRAQVFEDYRLQVGEIFADSASPSGQVPAQQRFDETLSSPAKAVTITEMQCTAAAAEAFMQQAFDSPTLREEVIGFELYESIYNPGKLCALTAWRKGASAADWNPAPSAQIDILRHRCVRVVRAYGLDDRVEAPQFYPARCPFVPPNSKTSIAEPSAP